MLAIQYLEPGPDSVGIATEDARARLRAAFERLPISRVILGWDLPAALIEACSQEASRAGARLLLWYPLLTARGTRDSRPEWQTLGLNGERVPGFLGLPEFTFVCPNRPAVQGAALEHMQRELQRGGYQGVFLDRIRYPSPSAGPDRLLACFCEHCQRAAADEGLDLASARRSIQKLLADVQQSKAVVRVLLNPEADASADPRLTLLRRFLDFRARSITRFVGVAADIVHAQGLEVALDLFSPTLTHMVGQDLAALNGVCSWAKVMTYGHTLAPAGVPYELGGLARWLIERASSSEATALDFLASAAQLLLRPTLDALAARGLGSEALAAETRRGRRAGLSRLLAGVELVDVEGVTRLNAAQIAADLRAFYEGGAHGLVLSWDLWRIPLERLDLVRTVWLACKPC